MSSIPTALCSLSFFPLLRRTKGKEGSKVTSGCTPAWVMNCSQNQMMAGCPVSRNCNAPRGRQAGGGVPAGTASGKQGRPLNPITYFLSFFCFSVFLAGLLECTLNNWNSSCNEILWIMGPKRKRWCLEFRSGALEYWNNIGVRKCNTCVQYSSLFSVHSAFLQGCCQIGAETAVAATVSCIFPARSLWMWIEI